MWWKLKKPRDEGAERRRSSGPLHQRNWVCKEVIWGNTRFPAALPFGQASVAAHPSRLPSLWKVLTFFFPLKQTEKEGKSLLRGLPAGFSWETFTRWVAGSSHGRAGLQLSGWTCRSRIAKTSPKLPSRNTISYPAVVSSSPGGADPTSEAMMGTPLEKHI